MRWNYLSITKLQLLQRWGLGMDKLLHPTHYRTCDYLSMLGLKLRHVSNSGPWWSFPFICILHSHVRSHYHYYEDLLNTLDNICQVYSIESLCKIKYILSSQLSYMLYMGLCVFSLSISPLMTLNIFTSSCYQYEIGNMNHYPLFRARSWNNGLRCMSYRTFDFSCYSKFVLS